MINTMKKIYIYLFTLLFIAAFSQTAYSQAETSFKDIITSVDAKVNDLETNQNQEIVNVTLDLLVNNGEKTIWRFLDPAFKYNALALGDSRISKLRIKVYKKGKSSANTDWDFVSELSAANPLLTIEPAEYKQYQFVISADEYKSGASTGHFGLILYHGK